MAMSTPFMHTPFSYTLSKNIKSRPTFIVSVIKIHEGTHETPKTRNWPNQQKIPTMKPKKSSELPLLEKIFNTLDKAIIKFVDPPLHLSVDPSYILSDNYAPVAELSPTECKIVHGSIPKCLDGVYIRNGPNPQFVPNGPHHYLDGDGMVHSIRISQGQATFCSRYVKTNKYFFERQAGSCVVPKIGGMQSLGPFIARVALFFARIISGKYDIGKGIGVANTNLAFFGGSLYALCESDLPYALKVQENGDIITLGQHDFNGKLSLNMTAHPKIDPQTKEAFAFRYWSIHPFLTYFRFDANGNKQPDVPIFSMKTPSLTHDIAITKKYAVIFDSQLGANPMNLIRGGQFVSVDAAKVPRIGLLPRYARDESDMKWFEVPGFNIFHVVNAWDEMDEDGNEVVTLVAPNILTMEHFFERMDLIQASMEKVTIQIGTGVVSRQTLSTDNLELPVINPAYASKKNKYIYAGICDKAPSKSRMLRIIGVSKLDTSSEKSMEQNDHTVACRLYGDSCYGSEPFFVARDTGNLSSEEDDGYLVSYVHNETSGESSFLVMDAQSPTLEIVAAVKLPHRVPYGLHGIFIKERDLDQML
uniref:probable carotenoid cleavage dioxygenase 4, chloroplastic n=1 Tax=Erigeron canadensis TaxID=72917 RepID=UPI001CB9AE65|nr:probable carotenoid cleavage dioxygenase 4, chloroplastic [Erigeron canadensis]